MSKNAASQFTVFTIGHSTHPFEKFLDMLSGHGINRLVDVRTIPKSRRHPQFNTEFLAAELSAHGIEYLHMKALGGLRKPRKDSPNTGWRNESFRGYADYMSTLQFQHGIERLIDVAREKPTTVMCAEAVPWRCHRSLIGDALLVRGIDVQDIMNAKDVRPHQLTSFAQVTGQNITYPAQATPPLFRQ